MSQPFPNYYLTRPNQVQIPLIPLDELPHWIEVGAWNWSDTSLFETMDPVTCDCIPRSGEYEVLCHYCAASVDKLHRSVSQQIPPSIRTPRTTSTTTTVRRRRRRPASCVAESTKQSCSSLVAQGIWPAVAPFLPRPTLTQPFFHASLRAPFVGMCLLDCDSSVYARWRQWRKEREERSGGETGVNLGNLQDQFLIRHGLESGGSGQKLETSGLKVEEPGQRSEEPGQKTEGSGQKTEESSPKPEEPGQKPDDPGQKPEEPGQKPEEPVQNPEPAPPIHDQDRRPLSSNSGGRKDNSWKVRSPANSSPDNQEAPPAVQKAISTYSSGSSGGPGARRIYWPFVDRYCKDLLIGGQESHPGSQEGPSDHQKDSPPRNQDVGQVGPIQFVRGLRYADLEPRQPESDQESEVSTSSTNGPLSPLSAMLNGLNSLLYPGQRRNPPLESVSMRQDGIPDEQDTSADSASLCQPSESTEVALPQLRLPSPVARVDFDPWAFGCLTPGPDSDAAVPSRGDGLSKSSVSVLSSETRSRKGRTRDSVGSVRSWETVITESSVGHENHSNKTHEAHGNPNGLTHWDTVGVEWLKNKCRVFGLSPVESRVSEEGDSDATREAETTFLSFWGSSNPGEPVKGDCPQDKTDEAHVSLEASKRATASKKRDRDAMNEGHGMTGTDKAVLKAQAPFPSIQKPKPVYGILRTGPVLRRTGNRRVSFKPHILSGVCEESSQAEVLSVDEPD